MCYPVTCKTCGKTSWGGCGAHINQVMGQVPEEKRCKCEKKEQSKSENISLGDIWRKLFS